MALQAGQFFRHVGAVGEIENLLDQALLVQAGGGEAGLLPDALQQLGVITSDGARH